MIYLIFVSDETAVSDVFLYELLYVMRLFKLGYKKAAADFVSAKNATFPSSFK